MVYAHVKRRMPQQGAHRKGVPDESRSAVHGNECYRSGLE